MSLIVLIFALIIGIVIAVLYLMNLQDALKEVSEENRDVPPVNAWLLLIPIFTLVYAFIFYPKLSDSIRKEYSYRGLPSDGDFGKTLGLTMAGLAIVAIIPIDTLSSIAGLANLVVLIILWVKIAKYKNELRKADKGGDVIKNNSSDLLDN